jgi:hypothetical protein
MRLTSAIALARVGAPAEKVLPVILEHLAQAVSFASLSPGASSAAWALPHQRDVDAEMNLKMNIWALKDYGPQAGGALETLSRLQTYPVSNVQELAREAAEKIANRK